MEGTAPKKQVGEVEVTKNYQVKKELFNFIPQESAELYKMVPLDKVGEMLIVGALEPSNIDIRDVLNFIASSQQVEYKLQQITQEQFNNILQQYSEVNNVMSETLEQLESGADVVLGIEEQTDMAKGFFEEEAPVIKLVQNILSKAVLQRASDIHMEPWEKYAVVRYRIDGVLEESLRFKRGVHDPVVARIKILAKLRLDERRRPQDGRFSSIIGGNRVDFRVASFPTSNGEKMILRVLDRNKGILSLQDLGLREGVFEKVQNAIKRPYGLILATGPTGAGKTTTLYALLNLINHKTQNIVSLEDPVEYQLDGVNQSNIRPEIGYSFATGLRSILRGDPDQILVGEIRDQETAQLATQAALTGHLVYATLHTNTAVGAISRLINFGIDPFLLAPTLALVLGQRMARRLDGEGKEMPINVSMRRKLEEQFADLPQVHKTELPDFKSFRDVVPTDDNPSGMKGRVGVFEILEITEDIKSIILKEPIESEIYKSARRDGYLTMSEDALIKGAEGIIPLSEAVKISNEGLTEDGVEEQRETEEKEEGEEVVQ